MEDLRIIIIRVVIFLSITQGSYTAHQEARQIAEWRRKKDKTTTPFPTLTPMTTKNDMPPKFSQNCNEVHNMDVGDSAVFFSEEGIEKRRCKYRFKSPEGTKINIECPVFDLNREGCKKESFIINERGKKKKNYCKRNRPPMGTGRSNRLTVTYRRKLKKEKDKDKKSRGYICRAFAIREDPGNTMYPGQPQGPGNTQYPGQPQGPGNTQYPGQPQGPGNTQYPGQPQVPGSTQYPGQPQSSGNTQDPGNSSPATSANPGVTTINPWFTGGSPITPATIDLWLTTGTTPATTLSWIIGRKK